MRDVPQLLRRGDRLIERCAERRRGGLVPRRLRNRQRDAKVVGQREQPLLCPVVQVAFDPASRSIRGLDDARTRAGHLGQSGERLGAEALVPERELRGRAELALEHVDRDVRLDKRDDTLLADERRDPPARFEAERAAVGADKPFARADRIRQPQSGIAERTSEDVTQPSLCARSLEIDRQASDAAANQERTEREPREPAREGEERERATQKEPLVERSVRRLTWLDAERDGVRGKCDAGERYRGERRSGPAPSHSGGARETDDRDERRSHPDRRAEAQHDPRDAAGEHDVVAGRRTRLRCSRASSRDREWGRARMPGPRRRPQQQTSQ